MSLKLQSRDIVLHKVILVPYQLSLTQDRYMKGLRGRETSQGWMSL